MNFILYLFTVGYIRNIAKNRPSWFIVGGVFALSKYGFFKHYCFNTTRANDWMRIVSGLCICMCVCLFSIIFSKLISWVK